MAGTESIVFDLKQISKIRFKGVSSTQVDLKFYYTYNLPVTIVILSDNSFGKWKCIAASLFT